MKTILFQGDSITDCHRDRNDPASMGEGYAMLAARLLEKKYPGQFRFVNRGISGNRSVDVFERRQADIFDVKPDYISILMGVNDVWHGLKYDKGVDVDTYLEVYSSLLKEIREKLPNAKVMLMEPFANEGTATQDDIEAFEMGVAMRSEAVQLLCAKYDLPFLSLQFDLYDLEEQKPAGHWTLDGVHPTLNFHQYMAEKWVKAFETYLK
ncbi:MAG: SGNH/GDSL hydrolase family protein [Oscillospiraceae bacterium]|nr:SGNH/GDSL hydrolase family protein [Oscillospiraceae bacterium]